MPLLLAYLKSVPPGHTHHLAKACYALENFVENLGPKVQPYLPELMECMLQPLRNTSTPRAKELAVSALGAIGEEKETGGGAQGSPREPLAGGPGIPSSWFCLSYSHGCPGFPSALLPHHHGAPAEIPGDRP